VFDNNLNEYWDTYIYVVPIRQIGLENHGI